MGTELHSQICTTRDQSERLMALGLKRETADMWYPRFAPSYPIPLTEDDYKHELNNDDDLPAWSLHRLAYLLQVSPYPIYLDSNAYEDIIDDIEDAIRQGGLVTYIE